MTIRVIVANSHESVWQCLVEFFHNSAVQIVVEAVNGEEAIEQVKKHKSDIFENGKPLKCKSAEYPWKPTADSKFIFAK